MEYPQFKDEKVKLSESGANTRMLKDAIISIRDADDDEIYYFPLKRLTPQMHYAWMMHLVRLEDISRGQFFRKLTEKEIWSEEAGSRLYYFTHHKSTGKPAMRRITDWPTWEAAWIDQWRMGNQEEEAEFTFYVTQGGVKPEVPEGLRLSEGKKDDGTDDKPDEMLVSKPVARSSAKSKKKKVEKEARPLIPVKRTAAEKAKEPASKRRRKVVSSSDEDEELEEGEIPPSSSSEDDNADDMDFEPSSPFSR